ncbi:MAG: hypothetical protein KF850_06910 [Labilithrix sp.]|nr:hypothetical protein [Labilithrix sp.]
MLRKFAVGLAGLVVVVACGSEPSSEFGSSSGANGSSGGGGDGGASGPFGDTDAGPPPPAVECKKMDIVFVIDNSQSMKEEQENLAKNFPEFVKVINEYKTDAGESLDYRVAVTTTDDRADQGKFRKGRGQGADQTCNPGPNNSPWLERSDDISTFFACRAQVGVLGSNVERPLESAKLAVTARIEDGSNALGGTTSFIREDALLAFVILTDEDEGSANGGEVTPAPVKDAALYATDFDAVKIFRGRWAAAVIAGDRGCQSELGQAADAVRLKQFITTTGKNGVFHSICDGDLTQGLQAALKTFTDACKEFPGVK